jgi:hypothetical protein
MMVVLPFVLMQVHDALSWPMRQECAADKYEIGIGCTWTGTNKKEKAMEDDLLDFLEMCRRWGIEIEAGLREAIQMQHVLDQFECRRWCAEFYDEKTLFEAVIDKLECKRAELMEGFE